MNQTPYKLSETCDHRPAIMDANGHNIVSWDPATIELFGDPRPAIITACNAYEELVKIAQAYRNHLKVFAHTEGEMATYQYINNLLTAIEKGG